MKLSIVIPCYNEAKNIPLLLARFKEVITRTDVEVVIVNNGSTDDSARVLAQLLPNFWFARSILVPANQGYGYGILQGLMASKGAFVGWTHADMQTDPADVLKTLEIIEHNGDECDLYIKGTRIGRPFFDRFFSVGMSIFESFYLKQILPEINAQPNVFSKTFFESWESPPCDFSLDLYALYMAKKKKLRIIRFPVLFPPRVNGASSWNTGWGAKWKFIKRTLTFSRMLKKRGIK